ncbi:MAG: hypothetical protein CVT67_09580 [Actinobacteria bacterium HGW-Actinobacteria-7]|jgi:anaerobic selenocysteine-containing dehydrogenase|nr:MAG: hypothetical protein CVT67_09580 [Actinobacteria bacterium HGW-Actinobacteria-7]
MATRDTGQPSSGISRRDFLKTTAAATAVVGCGLDFAYDADKAAAYEDSPLHTITTTTCPYCSASCGQRVVKEIASGTVVDIYGDFQSPFNAGGLCAKGAGSLQLVNNARRIGAFPGDHPVNNVFASDAAGSDATGIAWKRIGNGDWTAMGLQTAFDEIAAGDGTAFNEGMVAYRNKDVAGWTGANQNSKSVAFFGSSHINNEPNWMYRKLIAEFGTSNTEHQARI